MIYIRTEAALSFVHPKSLKNFISPFIPTLCHQNVHWTISWKLVNEFTFCPKIFIRPEKDKEILIEDQDVL